MTRRAARTEQHADARDYREALELVVEAFGTPPAFGNWPVDNAKIKALQQARQVLDDNLISHRHSGWEGAAEACPICRAHDALRRAEENELKAAAEADVLRGALADARAVIASALRAKVLFSALGWEQELYDPKSGAD